MRILHLPFGYYPDPVGGTEIYVEQLARLQRAQGHTPAIIAPAGDSTDYEHEGSPVFRYRVDNNVDDVRELYLPRTSVDEAGFARVVARFRPDILHVHGYTRAVTPAMLAAAKAGGVRVGFTYHTPTATCLRGTLLRWGHELCPGYLDAHICTACLMQAGGMPQPLARVAARFARVPGSLAPRGRAGTVLRLRNLVGSRHDQIRQFLQLQDFIIAPARWVMDLLIRIGVDQQRLFLNRQGAPLAGVAVQPAGPASVRSFAFFGRIDATKGLHVLLEAVRRTDAPLALHIYGDVSGGGAYAAHIRDLIAADARVRAHGQVPHAAVVTQMQQHDVVVVPSQWLETGPLVVLEAFAAGVPVVGSRLGGIAELVRDGIDGVLVDAADIEAWTATLGRLAHDRSAVDVLRAGVEAPRTVADVARELNDVYHGTAGAA